MKKKVVAVCATVALAAVAFGGATLAYFTDQDQVKNTFTIGDVSIDLWEKVGVNEDGSDKAVGVNSKEGSFEYGNLFPSQTLTKEPVIKNTSSENDAYVRVFVTVNNAQQRNSAIDGEYGEKGQSYVQSVYDSVFEGWGINNTKKADEISGYSNVIRNSMAQRTSDEAGVEIISIDSVRCPYVGAGYQWENWNLFKGDGETNDPNSDNNIGMEDGGYYQDALDENSSTYVFYLKLNPGASYTLFNGLSIPADFDTEQMAMFDGLNIGIYADAIQTVGFKDATEAFTALETAHHMGWWNN